MKQFYMQLSVWWESSPNYRIAKFKRLALVFFLLCTAQTMQAQQVYTFEYTGSIVEWTVPAGVTKVKMEAWGAQGGSIFSTSNYYGGKGAYMSGAFNVTPGQKLKILVGQAGGDLTNTGYSGSATGGGGGSFIAESNNTPLLVAGGGGGRRNLEVQEYLGNTHGTTTSSGQYSFGQSGAPGTNGNGGQSGEPNGGGTGGPGGGFYTDGGPTGNLGSSPGKAFVNGGAQAQTCSQPYGGNSYGGFGGGGAGAWCYRGTPGGGGGYSGGASGINDSGGGGGGSYNAGSEQNNISGVNTGNGKIVITSLYGATITETKSISCAGDATGELTATVVGGTAPYTYSWTPSGGTGAVASNLAAGTYTVSVTDALGAQTTFTKEIKVNDTAAPVITKTGTKVLSIPAGQSANWNMFTHTFADPLPAGAVVTGITLEYSGRDQNWGGTGAWARMIVSNTHIGSNQFFGTSQNFKIEYKGAVPGYVYGGNNFLRMDFDTWPGWVGYFNGGTMTIHYEMMPDVLAECSATISRAPSAVDGCNGTIIGTTTDPLTYTTQGTHVINWKFDDGNGNITTATQNVIIADKTNPTITAPATVTVNTDTGQNSASGVVLGTPVTADNCALGTTTNDAPATFPVGNTTVTWTVTDKVGNTATATQTVTVTDNEVPVPAVATLPDVIGECAATATTAPTATDNVSGTVTGTTTDALTYTEQGTYTITWTYTDAAGNMTTQQQKVIVKDITKPNVITQNITVNLDATGSATITAAEINNGSTDNCAIATNGYSLDKTSFTCANVGDNTVTLTVTDIAGNTESKTAIVTVKDVTAPLAKAKDMTVQLDANGAAVITPAMVDNGSSDLCGAVTLALSKTTFDCTNMGANTVTLTVTDGSGNETTVDATVTIEDKVAPTAIAKNVTITLDATGNATITAAQVDNGSTDNCGIETLALSKSAFDCSNVGENTVTLTVTDKSGNSHSATAIVTVEDNVAPVVITQNVTIQLDAAGNATITADAVDNGSSDACGINSMSLSKMAFDCSNIGNNTVTLTVTDNNGNVATKTANVTVEDKIAPTALTKNITVKLDAAGKATIVAADVDNGSSDVCGSVTLTIDKAAFDCSNIGGNTVTLTVTDAHGNEASENAIVTIVDDLAPVVLTQNITVKLDATGNATITTAQIDNNSTDNCGIASMTLDVTAFTCEQVGQNTVTLTVTDVNGNVATKEATVTVVDEIAPTAIAQNITAELDANGTVTITAAQVNNNSSDNCGIATMTLDTDTFGCSNLGENTVNLSVTDKAGNTAIAAAIVTIVDNIAPTITAPADLVLDVDAGKTTASNVDLGTPVTADNCDAATIVVTNDAPAEYPAGTTIVTWTATDASGNKTTATQTVTVRQDIAAVATLATINVPIRTAYANVPLPATVEVTYTNGQKEAIGVTWAQGTYNGLVAGTYVFTGQLIPAPNTTNRNSKVATISVVVEPNKAPTNLAFSATTFAPNAQADDVIGTLSTTDADDTEFVYTLVAGEGDAGNSLFETRGDKVYLKSNNGLSGKTTFSIRVRSTDPYQNTIEKVFTLNKEPYAKPVDKLKIVNAFSPNGDGMNDTWTIPELRFYNSVEIEVFDRAGVRLFHTTDPEMGWDGRGLNGQVLKGAFFYIVQVNDINLVKKGVVTILKK